MTQGVRSRAATREVASRAGEAHALAIIVARHPGQSLSIVRRALHTDDRFIVRADVSAPAPLRAAADVFSPAVIMLDITLMDSVGRTGSLRPYGVVVVTDEQPCPRMLAAMRDVGVRGAVRPTDPIDDIYVAAKVVLGGEYWMSPPLGGRLLAPLRENGCGSAPDASQARATLTARELDVLDLISRGYPNADIAERLYITRNTVKFHVRNLLVKLSARDRAHLVALSNPQR